MLADRFRALQMQDQKIVNRVRQSVCPSEGRFHDHVAEFDDVWGDSLCSMLACVIFSGLASDATAMKRLRVPRSLPS
jgi:hypothetical protein